MVIIISDAIAFRATKQRKVLKIAISGVGSVIQSTQNKSTYRNN